MYEHSKKEMKRGECFTFYKVGCQPWKHLAPEFNNVDVDEMSNKGLHNGEMSDYDSELEKE